MTTVEGPCYDCTHGGPCCDYSEHTECKHRREDGSCGKPYQPAKLDRSRWEGCDYCNDPQPYRDCVLPDGTERFLCSRDGLLGDCYINERNIQFCPMCGRPLTDAAWMELERRIAAKPLPNDPLTLEQLQEMDGDYVYIVLPSGLGNRWAFVQVLSGGRSGTHLLYHDGASSAGFLMDCGAKFYRRKLEERST